MIAFMLAWVVSAQASFFPDNGPIPSYRMKATPARAEAMLTQFQNEQEALVKAQNAELVIVPVWEDKRVNAKATRKDNQWTIEVYGGLLTHPDIGEEELMLVLCHELGHHLGGTPTASRGGWAACEGQADFWSGKSCGHLLSNPTEAALKLTRLYAAQGGGGYPELSTTDPAKVPRTFFGYPNPQCRLDTLLAGMNGFARPMCWFAE